MSLDDIEGFDSDAETLVDEELNAACLVHTLSIDSEQAMSIEHTNVAHGTTSSGHALNPEARVFTPAFSHHNNTPAPVNMANSALATELAEQHTPAPTVFAAPITVQAVNADLGGNTTSNPAPNTYGTVHGTFDAGLVGPQFQAPAFPNGMNCTHHLIGPFNSMRLQDAVNNNLSGTHIPSSYAVHNPISAQTPHYNESEPGHGRYRHVGVNPPFPNGNPNMTTVTMGLTNDINSFLQVGNVVSSLAIVNYGHTPAERNAGFNTLRQLHHLWINPARRPVRGVYYFDGENFTLRRREDNHGWHDGSFYGGRGYGGYLGGRGGFVVRSRDTYLHGPY